MSSRFILLVVSLGVWEEEKFCWRAKGGETRSSEWGVCITFLPFTTSSSRAYLCWIPKSFLSAVSSVPVNATRILLRGKTSVEDEVVRFPRFIWESLVTCSHFCLGFRERDIFIYYSFDVSLSFFWMNERTEVVLYKREREPRVLFQAGRNGNDFNPGNFPLNLIIITISYKSLFSTLLPLLDEMTIIIDEKKECFKEDVLNIGSSCSKGPDDMTQFNDRFLLFLPIQFLEKGCLGTGLW